MLNSGPCVTVRAVENKVATQLFWMVLPNGPDSWQLKSASRDRTYGGAEEGGEESEVNNADSVKRPPGRAP